MINGRKSWVHAIQRCPWLYRYADSTYFSERIGVASVEVESEARELNSMRITDYTPRYRKTNSLVSARC